MSELVVDQRLPAYLVMYSVSNFFLRWLLVLSYHISSYQLCNHGRSEGKRLSHAQSCAEVTRGGGGLGLSHQLPLGRKSRPRLITCRPRRYLLYRHSMEKRCPTSISSPPLQKVTSQRPGDALNKHPEQIPLFPFSRSIVQTRTKIESLPLCRWGKATARPMLPRLGSCHLWGGFFFGP